MGSSFMIFVSVGTHEQPFTRLIKHIDELKGSEIINQEVFIQKGFTSYVPKNCKSETLVDYETMLRMVETANIFITHGGPGNLFVGWMYKKIPIVVPRNSIYGEHVDDHQIDFVRRLEKENKIVAIYDILNMRGVIEKYEANKLVKNTFYKENISIIKLAKKIDDYCKDFSLKL